jgi:hypothetical protein
LDVVGIVDGYEYGTLENIATGERGDYLYDISEEVRFIPGEEAVEGSSKVWIGVVASVPSKAPDQMSSKIAASRAASSSQLPSSKKNRDELRRYLIEVYKQQRNFDEIKVSNTNKQTMVSSVRAPSAQPNMNSSNSSEEAVSLVGYGQLEIGASNSEEIMLGKTKYFAAVWENPARQDKMVIKEVETSGSGQPAAPTGLISGAFADAPVEIVSSGKSGVYWERKWASINSDGTISSGDLPSGMIRVVGRYWEAGKEYKVKLKASGGGELEVKVVKPKRLGNKYGKARDVFDNEVDVDSLIIANAGKYGIPPQITKAHISVEAATKDFGGDIKKGFAPSYRYEPYTTQNDKYLKDWSGNFFFEDSVSAYFSDVPKHLHVKDRNYYTSVKSVWDVIKEESQLVSSSGGKSYGKRDVNGKMDFGKYTTIQSKYNSMYKEVIEDTTKTLTQLADSTNKLMVKYLRDEWKPTYRSEVGAKNMIAQTRAASSYGFLQMLYTTARDEADYKESKVPEKMNEKEFFEEFLVYQRKLLNGRILKNKESEFDWNEGYEMLIKNSIFKIWNSHPDYPKAVLKEVYNYMPSKN